MHCRARNLNASTNRPPHTPSTQLRRFFARLSAALLLATALLLPAATYAAHPVNSPDDAQQEDVLAGVDKFAQGAKQSNEVTLDKNMIGLAGGMLSKKNDQQAKELMGKMDSVLVRNYEYAAPGGYKMEDVEQIRKRLESGGWSHIVKTHSATDATDIAVKTDAEGMMSEMVIINAEPLQLSFIHLRGHMSVKDLSQMSGSFGGPDDPMLKQRPK